MWYTLFSYNENVSMLVYEDISHFGYKIDTSDLSSLYKKVDFPKEIIFEFSKFINGDS